MSSVLSASDGWAIVRKQFDDQIKIWAREKQIVVWER